MDCAKDFLVRQGEKLRVIGWNCNMAYRLKALHVLEAKPDLLIVSECECPEKQDFAPQVREPSQRLWLGDNPNKGLGIFSYSDFTLKLHELYDPSIKYVAPIEVDKKSERFTLLAVWAMNDIAIPERRYIGRVWQAINSYKSLLNDPVLIVGDFNWNKIWDKSPGLGGNLSQTIEFLAKRGIVSLYHSFMQETFGEESFPTLYLHKKRFRPYHVDYIFASQSFLNRLHYIEVGTYEDWIAFSDHMPMTVGFLE